MATSYKEQRASLIAQANALLSNSPYTKEHDSKFKALMLMADSYLGVADPNEGRATNEQRSSADIYDKAFRMYLRNGDRIVPELRTYAAEDTSLAGSLIPVQWAAEYVTRLTSFNGIREAGATVATTKTGALYHDPYLNDFANTGERLAENANVTLANPTVSETQLHAFRYGSRGVQVSNELVNDSAYDLDSALQGIFARRIGKLTNTEFTLGASGGPAGVIPSLNVGVTAASATAVTLAELAALPASIDYGYRQPEANPVWSFSPGVEKLLKSMTATGLRLFPEMEDGELLGYPYVINVDMASAFATNAKAIVFGSFKKGVTIRQVTPILTVSKERFAEYFQTYYSMIHRQDCVVSDANALAVLQMAAS